MSSVLANNFLLQLFKKEIDFDTDVFKIVLMSNGFIFNRITHVQYSSISASELITGSGYTAGGVTLSGVAVAQDDTLGGAKVVWNNVSWTATGGSIITSGAIIYDSTTSPEHVVGYIDFNGTQTATDGTPCTIVAPTVALKG